MRKFIKGLALCALLLCVCVVTASAEVDGLYNGQYKSSGAGELYDALPQDAKQIFDRFGITSENNDWLAEFSTKNIFDVVLDFLKQGAKQPLAVFFSILGIVLLCAAASGMGELRLQGDGVMDFIASLSVAAVVLAPLHTTIEACVNAIRANGSFMLSFVPVFTAVVAAGGQTATAAGSGAVLLIAAEATVSVIAFVIMPLCSCYLAVSLCTAVNPLMARSEIASLLQKATNWILGLTLTVFLGVLSVQTSIGSAADTVSARAVKFAVGSAVPVVGASVSEALGTVKSCLGLLKTSVGIYGVIAVGAILIPVITSLVLWRAAVTGGSVIANLFGCGKISGLLKAVDSVLSILLGIVLYCVILFIIALTIVTKAGG
ncbi:MAG: hypothetical protein J6I80_04910 [Clostridia bacterium]|nr:hypothetical protein [Clostridia bacterium]